MSMLRAVADAWTANSPFRWGGKPSNEAADLRSRSLSTWRPSQKSADGDLLPEKGTLTNRSRDLERNSGIAKSGIQTTIDNVVGTGLRLVPKPNYLVLGKTKAWSDAYAKQVRAQWLTFSDTTACDAADTVIFDQMTAMQLRSKLLTGDDLCLPLWLPDRGDGWATKLQTVDPDRMSNPNAAVNSSTLRDGVVIDAYGAPVGYQIRRTHPADYMFMDATNAIGVWDYIPKRTPFGRRRVIHGYDKERSGQSRGRPIMASIMANFKGLDRYMSAEVQAAVVNAMVAMVIETPLDQDHIEGLFRDDPTEFLKARERHAVEIQSGLLATLFPGDKLSAFAPSRPSSALGAFVENIGRIMALGFDMPYELLFKDFTKANYSSMRAAMLEAWRSFNRRRDDLGTQWADPVYQLWLEEAINAGKIDGVTVEDYYANVAAYCRCSWIGPGRGMVDPVKEAQAAQIRMEAGISTLQKECAEQGSDWEDDLEQQANEMNRRRELGLPDVVYGRATVVPEDNAAADAGVPTPGTAPAQSAQPSRTAP